MTGGAKTSNVSVTQVIAQNDDKIGRRSVTVASADDRQNDGKKYGQEWDLQLRHLGA
jgi:hypothetical protein